jgi:hypothetical protein
MLRFGVFVLFNYRVCPVCHLRESIIGEFRG